MEYLPYRACYPYLQRDCTVFKGVAMTGNAACAGQFCFVRPFCTERYVSDMEPDVRTDLPLRPIIWYRIHRQDVPKGWQKSPGRTRFRKTGYAELEENYLDTWSDHAKRHVRRWEKQTAWELYTPIPQEYLAAYKEGKRAWHLTYFFSDMLKKKIRAHGERVRLFGVRKKGERKLHAGLAVVDIPEASQSVHFSSFILNEARETGAGVALINEWFRTSMERGYQFADFDLFWAPGDKKEWKGFSQFKSQFGVRYIDYPVPLVRFAGNFWYNFKKQVHS